MNARIVAAVAAALTLGVALFSPITTISLSLLSMHMLQHLLLMQVAAPLIILSLPLPWGHLRVLRSGRRFLARLARVTGIDRLWHHASAPAGAVVVQAIVLTFWHLPGIYESALHNHALHVVEHLTFLSAATLFWSAVIGRRARGRRVLVAVACLFAATLQSGIIAALLTLSRHSWYDVMPPADAGWSLSPLADQQLAGVLMWGPGSVPYLIAAAWLLWRTLGQVNGRRSSLEHPEMVHQ